MKRYFNKIDNSYNNYCDTLENFMVEIPDDGKPYGLVNNEVVDISNTPAYIAEQKANAKETQRTELQVQIDELEKSQMRAIREVALGKSLEFSMGKLQDLDNQIAVIRTQIGGLNASA